MNKAIILSTAFVASAAIAWMAAAPFAPPPRRQAAAKTEPPPRPTRTLTRAQVDADPAYNGAMEKIRTATTTKDRLQSAYDLAHSIPQEDLEKWLTGDLFKEEDARLVAFFRSILFGRYSSVDPVGCALAMEKSKEPGLRAHIKRWAEVDHQAVLELASKPGEQNFRRYLLEAGLGAMAGTNPKGMLAILEKERQTYLSFEDIMVGLAPPDRQMVLDWADDPRRENLRDDTRASIAKTWFQQDFNGALAWARQQEDAKSLIAPSLYNLGLSPSGYLDKIGSLPPELITSVLQKSLKSGEDLDAWLAYDYEGKAGLSEAQAKAVRLSAIGRMAFVDTAKALEAVKVHGLPDPAANPHEFRTIVSDMNRGFEAMGGEVLEEWRTLLGDDGKRLTRFGGGGMKLNFPVPPADAIKQLAETGKITDTGFIRRWTREEMRLAIETLPSIPAEQFDNLGKLVSGASEDARMEFEMAILAAAAQKNVSFPDYSSTRIGYQMARNGPTAATEWAKTLPPGRSRDRVIRGITAHMQAADPGQAQRWLEGLEPADRNAAEQVVHHIRTVHGDNNGRSGH